MYPTWMVDFHGELRAKKKNVSPKDPMGYGEQKDDPESEVKYPHLLGGYVYKMGPCQL